MADSRSPEQVAKEILSECRCHDAYTSRKMIDPGCMWHEYHLEFEEALSTFAAQQKSCEKSSHHGAYLAYCSFCMLEQVREAERRVWEEAAKITQEHSVLQIGDHVEERRAAIDYLVAEFRRRSHATQEGT